MIALVYLALGLGAFCAFVALMYAWAIFAQLIFGKSSKAFAIYIGGIMLTLGGIYYIVNV